MVYRKERYFTSMHSTRSFLVALFLFGGAGGCTPKYGGVYYSACRLYGQPEVVVHVLDDHQFRYDFVYAPVPVTGTWQVVQDTLVFRSPVFTAVQEPGTPIVKFNYRDSVDRFAFRNRRLHPLVGPGTINKRCFLARKQR